MQNQCARVEITRPANIQRLGIWQASPRSTPSVCKKPLPLRERLAVLR